MNLFANSTSLTITQKRIASPKLLQLICSSLAFLVDVAVLVILIGNTTDFMYLLCPILLAVFDVIFVVGVFYSNYRFSYALKNSVLHSVVILAISALALVYAALIDTRTVFADIMIYAMPAVHAVQCFSVILNAVHSINKKQIFNKAVAIAAAAIFAVSAVTYGMTLLSSGFFGQGASSEKRTVTYELNEAGSGYVVTGVLSGFGKTVEIPESFNELPITAIDCRLFTNEKIETVMLNCSSEVAFVNAALLDHSNSNITIETSKENLNDFRRAFYSLAFEYHNFLEIANSLIPNDMGENQVYVTFCYTYDMLKLSNEILDVWFGAKGDTFSLSNHAGAISYIEHSNVNDANDMYWCYENQQRMIFSSASNGDGENVDGMTIVESQISTIFFDKIYKVVIEEDNDTKYSIDKTHTTITVDGTEHNFKLATEKSLMTVLNNIPGRDGFVLDWKVGSNKHEIGNISEELSNIENSGLDIINMHPVWSLLPPTITLATANGLGLGCTAVYGTNVALAGSAVAPHESISVRYEWRSSKKLSDTNTYTISNIHPDDDGKYILYAISYSDSTSLTGVAQASVTVKFAKKTLNISWTLPENLVYSAENKPVSIQYNPNDVINGDTISTTLDKTAVKDAGTYTIKAGLAGDCAKKYEIPTSSSSTQFEISPYPISVNWSNTVLEYNGTHQAPTATVWGLGNDGHLDITVASKKDAGTYEITAFTSNANYTLTDAVSSFIIQQKPISEIYWSDENILEYNGADQYLRVANLDGVVYGEENSVLSSLIYDGKAKDVGSYIVTVSLPEKTNYVITCSNSSTYSISPKSLYVMISDKSVVYDGKAKYDFTFTTTSLASGDKIDEVLTLSYKGDAYGAVNASTYTIDADAIPASKYNNYSISIESATLTITQRPLNIKINGASKVYDGKPYTAGFSFTHSELAENDLIDDIVSITYTGAALTETNAASHLIDANIEYLAKSVNYSVSYNSAYLVISKAPLKIKANSGTKTYDGSKFASSAFNVTAEGLVNGETLASLGTISYSGTATTATNAGSYTLNASLSGNAASRNYSITYESGAYTINKKAITVTAVATDRTFAEGVTGGTFDFTVTGLISTDTKAMLGTPTYSGTATTATAPGTYVLYVKLPDNSVTANYDITYVSDSGFTISAK